MKTIDYITPLDLYAYAKTNNLLNARIRICDGMAVSYYPDPGTLSRGRYEVVIDVSANDPIEFDELDCYAQRLDAPTENFDELDALAHAQYTADRGAQNHRFVRDMACEKRKEWLRKRQVEVNQLRDPDDITWPIYGYNYLK